MTDRPPMEINVRESNGIYVLEVHGRLTIGEASEQLTDALQSTIERGARKVIVNLNGVPQIDSSGISSLVRISIRLARENGAMHIVCGPGRPYPRRDARCARPRGRAHCDAGRL